MRIDRIRLICSANDFMYSEMLLLDNIAGFLLKCCKPTSRRIFLSNIAHPICQSLLALEQILRFPHFP